MKSKTRLPAVLRHAVLRVGGLMLAGDARSWPPAGDGVRKDGAKTTMEIYGFAMLDMGYQTRAERSGLVRRPAADQAARRSRTSSARTATAFAGVRQSRFGVKTNTPTSARASSRPRSSSSSSAPASTPARPRSGCATPTASSASSAPARRGARSWTSTCSRTRSSTGDRTAWCSSATSRCAGCRSRATRA